MLGSASIVGPADIERQLGYTNVSPKGAKLIDKGSHQVSLCVDAQLSPTTGFSRPKKEPCQNAKLNQAVTPDSVRRVVELASS